MTVPIRWLLLGLLISVGALVMLAVSVARHIRRQRRPPSPDMAATAEKSKGEE